MFKQFILWQNIYVVQKATIYRETAHYSLMSTWELGIDTGNKPAWHLPGAFLKRTANSDSVRFSLVVSYKSFTLSESGDVRWTKLDWKWKRGCEFCVLFEERLICFTSELENKKNWNYTNRFGESNFSFLKNSFSCKLIPNWTKKPYIYLY